MIDLNIFRFRLITLYIKVFFPFLLAIIIICDSCTSFKSPAFTCEQIRKQYFSILQNTPKNKISEVIDNLNDAINKNKTCLDAYSLLADIYLSIQNYAQAEKNLRIVLKFNSRNIYSLFKMGVMFEKIEKYDSAAHYFDSAESFKNDNGFVLDYKKDLENITGENNYDIEYSEIIFQRGVTNYFKGDLLNSMYDLNYCIQHNKIPEQSYFFRALVYLKIEDNKRACSDFKSAQSFGNTKCNEYLKKYSCAD